MTLAEFLLARIAHDERFAKEAGEVDQHWEWVSCAHENSEPGPGWVELRDSDGARWGTARYAHHRGHHIAVHDPARVLAECQAKRQIIATCMGDDPDQGELDPRFADERVPATVLRLLALPYADHPDYRSEWRP